MIKAPVAGLFIIDARLLSSIEYLAFINESLLKFYIKYPEAYITIAIFDILPNLQIRFQKMQSIPKIQPLKTLMPVKIFDTIGQLIEKHEWLLPIYDISQVHVWIAAESKDQGSQIYTLFDIAKIIEQKKEAGWKFYFPFARFEELHTEPFYVL